MIAFDRLHPAIQHHVVNSLRWPGLRPLQEAAVEPLLAGQDALLLAPTAGGKTEAALLPLLSRMLNERWGGLSIAYVCPIKALLNNLHGRLERLTGFGGRRAALWHGDVGTGERKAIRRDPPDVLLTTPESLEAILVSTLGDPKELLGNLRAVVVDEVHAFAGDDRGWHLLGVLGRLEHLAGRPIQRVGLSATVGAPERLLAWLSPEGRPSTLIAPEAAPLAAGTDVALDFVGSLANAASVIAQLHRGRKRLVFCDSRARVEELSTLLRGHGVSTFVSHSSLGLDERRAAERSFAEGTNCVIVATSTLELGLDVGDLDHVIQIDAPATVASFLQRLGRTGRRPGSVRNCLFLATDDDGLLRAAGLLRLWRSGFVEPVEPPPLPYHLVAQQLMALALQRRGIRRDAWQEPLSVFLAQAGIERGAAAAILDHMVASGILVEADGVLWFGEAGEREFGRRNFMELLAVFASEPLLTVLAGRSEIGWVHPLSVGAGRRAPLSLAGRSWDVVDVDWRRRTVSVVPSTAPGKSRWKGGPMPLSFELCRSCRSVLRDEAEDPGWSRRAKDAIRSLRESVGELGAGDENPISLVGDRSEWRTAAGLVANIQLAAWLERTLGVPADADNFAVRSDASPTEVAAAVAANSLARSPIPFDADAAAPLAEGIKFTKCVPEELLRWMLEGRFGASACRRHGSLQELLELTAPKPRCPI